jgi:hypothetical protein
MPYQERDNKSKQESQECQAGYKFGRIKAAGQWRSNNS